MKNAILEIASLEDCLTIYTPPSTTVEQVRAKARLLKARGAIDLIVVDYLQLLSVTGRYDGKENVKISQISRGLKMMAVELGVPVLTLSQFSRDGAKAEVPKLHHLRDSGAIEQDANVVLFIHQEPKANPWERVLIVAKRRNGGRLPIQLRFDGPRFDFSGVTGAATL